MDAPMHASVFPMPVPFPSALDCFWHETARHRSRSNRERSLEAAQNLVILQVCLLNSYMVHCPQNCSLGRCPGRLSLQQREVAERLLQQARPFVAQDGGVIPDLGRGRPRILAQLSLI